MNILVVSNMHPSKEKPYSGLFVLNQINEIKKNLNEGDNLIYYSLKRTFTSKFGTILKYFKFFLLFPTFILKNKMKYDVVHVHYYFPTIYVALIYRFLFNKEVEIVVTFHGGDVYRGKKNFFYKYPFKRISKIIVVSSELAEQVLAFTNQDVEVIPAGINSIFNKTIIENQTSKKYDLIFIGSFYKVKGFDVFCNVLNEIEMNLNVCIIGSGELESCISQIDKRHTIKVLINLKQEEIVKQIRQSRFCINTSRQESFGLSMTESMACGVPVIATRTNGSVEQIIEGLNGKILKYNEIKAMATEIDEYLKMDDLIYRKLEKGALMTSEKYKLPQIAQRILKLYRKEL